MGRRTELNICSWIGPSLFCATSSDIPQLIADIIVAKRRTTMTTATLFDLLGPACMKFAWNSVLCEAYKVGWDFVIATTMTTTPCHEIYTMTFSAGAN